MSEEKKPWVDQHWLWRGFQSAVFLYASCGPCIAWRDGRRQKKQYKREKEERARLPVNPNILRQPAPHDVNPHWEEEIRLGPGPPKRGRKRGNTKSSRETVSSGTLCDTATSSKSDLAGEKKRGSHSIWTSRSFQRADEEFVYVDGSHDSEPVLIRQGSSTGVSGWVADSEVFPERPRKVYVPPATMPPLNELHPPIVSSVPVKRDHRAWMKAPPPSAAFMHGLKDATTRPRSSGNSSLRNSDSNLSRQVGHRIVEEKLKQNSQLYGPNGLPLVNRRRVDSKLDDDAPSESSSTTDTSYFRLAREKQPSPTRKPRRRPAPLRLNSNQSMASSRKAASRAVAAAANMSDAQLEDIKPAPLAAIKPKMTARSGLNSHPVATDPTEEVESASVAVSQVTSTTSLVLPTTSTVRPAKDSATPTPLSADSGMKDDYDPSPRKIKERISPDNPSHTLLVKDSSLHVLQDVVDPALLLNSHWVKSPVIEARVPLPPGDSPRKEEEPFSVKHELLRDSRRWSFGM